MTILLCDTPTLNASLASLITAYSAEKGRVEQDRDYIAHVLTSPNAEVLAGFVALDGDRNLVGGATVATGPAHKSPELRTAYVLPSHRGMGIGKRLVAAQVAWAFMSGYETVYSTCVADNEASIGMLLDAGFQLVGEDPVDRDCVVLSLSSGDKL